MKLMELKWKPWAILVVLLALIMGLSMLPTAGGASPVSSIVKTTTRARAASNELRAGERLKAPKLGRVVKRYQWLRCDLAGRPCQSIRGATRRFYIVRAADVGHVLRVREVLQGNAVAVSAPTAEVGLPLPMNTAVPTVTDNNPADQPSGAPVTVNPGDILTGTTGTWTNAVAYTYQWLDCDINGANCTPISGATTLTYTVQNSDLGDTIVLQVTGYNYNPDAVPAFLAG